jgi:hypothetical protein
LEIEEEEEEEAVCMGNTHHNWQSHIPTLNTITSLMTRKQLVFSDLFLAQC